MYQKVTETCATSESGNWWHREDFFAVGRGLKDVDLFRFTIDGILGRAVLKVIRRASGMFWSLCVPVT